MCVVAEISSIFMLDTALKIVLIEKRSETKNKSNISYNVVVDAIFAVVRKKIDPKYCVFVNHLYWVQL